MEQIIKSFCVCACVCPSVDTLTVAIFVDFHQIGHRRVNPQKQERDRWGVNIAPPLPLFFPKTPNFGAWMGVFKPNSRNQKSAYYQNYCIDSNQILHSDKDHQMPFVGGPHTRITNPRLRTAAILKNLKIAISHPRSKRFRRNLAWWCCSPLLSILTVNNLKFQKSKMAPAAMLKNRKLTYLL